MNSKREIGLFLGYGPGFTYPVYRTIVQEAEALGYDVVWAQDNLTGHHPVPRDVEIIDPYTLFSALAAETTKIHFGPMATPACRRYAPLLAKTTASLDYVSNGRLRIGLGSGDDRFQYEMIGQRFPDTGKERRQILSETIQVMKLMWTEESAYFEGEHFRLEGAILSPKPVQKPNPPIYIACNTSRRLMPRMAAEHGNGLAMMWGHEPSVATTVNAFQEEWEAFGRDPEEYAALRSAFIIFCNDEDPDKAREYGIEMTGFPETWEEQASPANVPEGSDPDLFIVGRPSTVADKMKRSVFEMGFNQVMCWFVVCEDIEIDTDGIPGWPGNYLGGMRLFVDEVLPLLD